MGALLRVVLVLVGIGVAVEYWYITLPALALVAGWALMARREAERRAAMLATAITTVPPAPGRIAGPVRWRCGVLEVTPDELVVTTVDIIGQRALVSVRRTSTLRLSRLLRVERTTTPEGENLAFLFKGGARRGFQGCGDGEAIIRLLDALAADVPVVENGVRWPAPRTARRRAAAPLRQALPVAVRCPACGAPLDRGVTRCGYCRAEVGIRG